MDKEGKKREEEAGKVLRLEIQYLDNDIIDIKKTLDVLPKLEKGISSRMDEETRLARQIDELRRSLDEMRHDEEESLRTYRLIEDGRRQDTKRLNDLLAEVTGLRKRLEDQRGQNELTSNSLRKLESRLGELSTQETERREAKSTFLDRQAVLQVERDRVWRDWESRFTTIEKQALLTETQNQSLEVVSREAKRAQQPVEELAQKLERRVSEITEIQRLSEAGRCARARRSTSSARSRRATRWAGTWCSGTSTRSGASAVRPGAAGHELLVAAPPEVMGLLVPKGSVAVDGVSLTAGDLERDGFWLYHIPETLARTTLGTRAVGDEVNLEADYLAKLVKRFVERLPAGAGQAPPRAAQEG